MTEKLLPCPFCGAEPRYFDTQDFVTAPGIICDSCNIEVLSQHAKRNSALMWNTRPAHAPEARMEPAAWIVSGGDGYERKMFEKLSEAKVFARELRDNGWDDIVWTMLYDHAATPTPSDAMTESVVQDDRYSTAIVWSDEDQAYLASTPELPGCIADGQTKAEALRELADARAVWIGAATEIGKTIPGPTTLDNFPDGIATSKAPQAGLEPLYRGAAPEAWQDISTAPTYETILVAGGDANYPVTACWDGDPQDGWYVDGQEDTHVEIGWPTHWMPLPEGPAVARKERGVEAQ